MAYQKIVVVLGIPCSHGPIIGATEEDLALLTPEWVASDSVDGPSVTIVIVEILIRI